MPHLHNIRITHTWVPFPLCACSMHIPHVCAVTCISESPISRHSLRALINIYWTRGHHTCESIRVRECLCVYTTLRGSAQAVWWDKKLLCMKTRIALSLTHNVLIPDFLWCVYQPTFPTPPSPSSNPLISVFWFWNFIACVCMCVCVCARELWDAINLRKTPGCVQNTHTTVRTHVYTHTCAHSRKTLSAICLFSHSLHVHTHTHTCTHVQTHITLPHPHKRTHTFFSKNRK